MVLGLLAGLLTVASGLWLEPQLQAWGTPTSPSHAALLKNIVKGLPPSYSSLSTHGVPALLGSLAGLLLAGLAEEKSGSMQVFSNLALPNFSYLGIKKNEKMICSMASFSIHSTPAAPLQ